MGYTNSIIVYFYLCDKMLDGEVQHFIKVGFKIKKIPQKLVG